MLCHTFVATKISAMCESNPVIEVYHGVKIRKSNRVVMRFGVVEYKRLLDEVDSAKLSIHKVLAYSGKPCNHCQSMPVVVMNAQGDEVKIKRGILSVPESNGVNILQLLKCQQASPDEA